MSESSYYLFLLLTAIFILESQSVKDCYDELGCFPQSHPWVSFFRPFPAPYDPSRIDTRLYLYTRCSSERFNIKLWPTISVKGSHFKPNRKNTVFVIHGFANSADKPWLSDLKNNYLKLVNANVFLVDWGKGAQLLNYPQVASNTRIVGAEVARFIMWLINHCKLPVEKVHLIGHSLGAQICGYIGKKIPGIGEITGLDPAQPGFEGLSKKVRLDKRDAKFVCNYHTDGRPFIPFFSFGIVKPHGHVDFYFNRGFLQPGCGNPLTLMQKITKNSFHLSNIKNLLDFTVEEIAAAVGCSHSRGYEYFIDTMGSPCTLLGQKADAAKTVLNAKVSGGLSPKLGSLNSCTKDTCIPVGLDTHKYKARGVFTVMTTDQKPYCNKNSTQKSFLDWLGF